MIYKRQQMIFDNMNVDNNSPKNSDNKLDNFRIFEKQDNEQNSLIAIQKDGVGVYLANSHMSSTFLSSSIEQNGTSVKSTYSEQNSEFLTTSIEIKV